MAYDESMQQMRNGRPGPRDSGVRSRSLPFGLRLEPWPALLALCAIGLTRNLLEVALGIRIHPKWYVLDADVMFTMAFFVPHFCFWGGALLHVSARLMRRRLAIDEVVSLLFCLQLAHLTVPFVDWIGLRLGVPWYWELPGLPVLRGPYFTSVVVMTPGIAAVWCGAGLVMLRVLTGHFALSLGAAAFAGLVTFSGLFWPIYHVWPTFNTWFDQLVFGIEPTPNLLPQYNFWGYGTYFALSSLSGIVYWRWSRAIEPESPPRAA